MSYRMQLGMTIESDVMTQVVGLEPITHYGYGDDKQSCFRQLVHFVYELSIALHRDI